MTTTLGTPDTAVARLTQAQRMLSEARSVR